MFCQNCGTKNKPGAKFCRKCGTALRQPATQPTPVTSQTAPTIPQPAPKQKNETGISESRFWL
ncbi:zinc-ribbon domain-containing protein [Pediococcus acidilactici]